MNRLIIAGSVRPEGRSAHLAHALAHRMSERFPHDEAALFSLADDVEVDPCLACDFCKLGEGCVVEDDMQDVYALMEAADSLTVVSPVYFAGPPAPLKALLDRFQRYFWTDLRAQPKRPAQLYVIGDGGDPHGFQPLTGIVRSALAVAGFRLDAVHDCVGKTFEELDAVAAAWMPDAEGEGA